MLGAEGGRQLAIGVIADASLDAPRLRIVCNVRGAIRRCPQCGQTVTPYAAGCAVCGADLEAARAKRAARRGIEPPRLPFPDARATGDSTHIVIAFLLALFVSPLGLLLALFWAYQRHSSGDTVMTVVMLAAAALAVAALVAPVWFWSRLY
jgi:hypothetical protein